MNKIYFLALISIVVQFGSCNKDEIPSDEIVIGQTDISDMNTHIFSPTLNINTSENGGLVADTLDILFDGINDLSIEVYGSKWAKTRGAYIVSLHSDIKILSVEVFDTLRISYLNTNPLINTDTVVYNSYSGFISGQTNDSVTDTYIDYYPKKLESGTHVSLSNSDNVWHDIGIFNFYANGYHYSSPNEFNYLRKSNWNNAGVKYVCFKLEVGNESKLGWLKINVSSDYHIDIYEYAIQN